MTRPIVLIAIALAGMLVLAQCGGSPPGDTADAGAAGTTSSDKAGDEALADAFQHHLSDREVEGRGTVVRILPDDDEGSRHQRFIVRLASGQTLLVAHNIDVAPRVEDLHEGDAVAFRGVYEWTRRAAPSTGRIATPRASTPGDGSGTAAAPTSRGAHGRGALSSSSCSSAARCWAR